jgi:hypothetical protein
MRRSWLKVLWWVIVGAVFGAAMVAGNPIALAVGLAAVIALAIVTLRRPREVSGPSFVIGTGVCGFALSAFSSANGYFGSFATGVSGSYSQARGSVGHTAVHSAFSISGMLAFAIVFAVGITWLLLVLHFHFGGGRASPSARRGAAPTH